MLCSFSALTLLVGQRFHWSYARLKAPVVTAACITFSSNKIQNEDNSFGKCRTIFMAQSYA